MPRIRRSLHRFRAALVALERLDDLSAIRTVSEEARTLLLNINHHVLETSTALDGLLVDVSRRLATVEVARESESELLVFLNRTLRDLEEKLDGLISGDVDSVEEG